MINVFPFILKRWRLLATIGVTLLILYLVLALRWYKSENARNSADLKVVTGVVTGEGIKTSFYKNKLEQQVAKTATQYVTKETMTALLTANDNKWKSRFDVKPKQIESATTTEAVIDASVITLTPAATICDSVKTFTWVYKDDWNDITLHVLDTPKFKMVIKLFELEIWQRKKLFAIGPRMWPAGKEWFKEITTPNPLVKLNSQVIYTTRKRSRGDR